MPELWKALGDVYGDADPDGVPTRVEPPAARRSAPPLDDDLAAALSAALVNAPAPAPTPVPPRPAPVPTVAPAPAPAPTPAPIAPAPAPVASLPVPEAQEKVASWLVEIEQRQSVRDKGPDLDAALPAGPTWARVDDDILPATKAGRRRK